MAGLDKEESISLIQAGRDIFLRFGSTRIFLGALALSFLYGLARLDPINAVIYAAMGSVMVCGVAFSLHLKPHIDRVNP